MKTKILNIGRLSRYAIAAMAIATAPVTGLCQGVVTFHGQMGLYGTNYIEGGIWFRVVIPTFGTASGGYDSLWIAPAITSPANIPYNDTPYMIFYRQFSPDNYVVVSRTTGDPFGIFSVQLADPSSPSSSLLPITFLGFRTDGSTVSQTFITPGGGANRFQSYQFSPDFTSGLLSVQIDAPRWAMDNLVWVPEPGPAALLGLGLLAVAWRYFNRHRTS